MSDQDRKQGQGTQHEDWKKNPDQQQQGGQQQGGTGGQKSPQSDRERFEKDQQKKQA